MRPRIDAQHSHVRWAADSSTARGTQLWLGRSSSVSQAAPLRRRQNIFWREALAVSHSKTCARKACPLLPTRTPAPCCPREVLAREIDPCSPEWACLPTCATAETRSSARRRRMHPCGAPNEKRFADNSARSTGWWRTHRRARTCMPGRDGQWRGQSSAHALGRAARPSQPPTVLRRLVDKTKTSGPPVPLPSAANQQA